MEKTNTASSPAQKKQTKTPNQMRALNELNKEKAQVAFKKAQESLQLLNPNRTETRSYTVFSKSTLRSYMQNPMSNYRNIRSLSRFLYYRSSQYRRLLWYNASMLHPEFRSVVPTYSLVKENNPEKVLKQYTNTIEFLDDINFAAELLKMYIISWREDTSFGCVYYTKDQGMFILPLDGDYCQISSIYSNGSYGFSMDMTYFRSRQEQLGMWGEPFQSMWNEYQKDTSNGRWQPMPDEYAICFKINTDDTTLPLPPYLALFNSLITLCDLEDLQDISDEMGVYKLLVGTMETISGSEIPDDFAVDPQTAIDYWNRLIESLPSYIGAVLSPVKVESLNFNDEQAQDVNRIQKATETLFTVSGGAQILNSSSISGSTAWNGAIVADSEYAMSSLIPQTEQWLNRFVSYYVSNPAKIKLLEVTSYTKEAYKKAAKEDATYGLPTKLALNTLNGFSELDTLALNYLEDSVLKLSESFIPLQSSHTQSGNNTSSTGGAPVKDNIDRTDAGAENADEEKGK